MTASAQSPTKPLVLVDGSSYLFRAFHALPPLVNKHGEPTGAMHGVLNMLDKLRRDYQPEHMVVVFDAKGKTFRHDLYNDYKANRPPMPDDLRVQIEPLLTIIRAQGYPLLMIDYVEADDVIGTLASEFAGSVIISTGDKDMAQLVNERVSLINTMNDEFLDREGVQQKFGVPPERICDYLSLIGDKVDNVPGVDKVGPKTAVKWLNLYDSLQNIIENADKIKGKVGENLRRALPQLPLSYELVTIKRDVAVDCDPDKFTFCQQDNERLRELYERYGFRTRLKQLNEPIDNQGDSSQNDTIQTEQNTPLDYQIIHQQAQLDTWLNELNKAEQFAFDFHYQAKEKNNAEQEITSLALCMEHGKVAFIPFVADDDLPNVLSREKVFEQLQAIFADESITKITHHLKTTLHYLTPYNIKFAGKIHDIVLQSYLLDATQKHDDIEHLSEKYLNLKPTKSATPPDAQKADLCLRLHQTLYTQLKTTEPLLTLYEQLELPLLYVLTHIENNGVFIDREQLATQSNELAQQCENLEQRVHELAGERFNLNSTKQLQSILYDDDKLNLPILKKTPKGSPSTAEEVLQELAQRGYDLPRLILDYRSLIKLKSTYTDKLPRMIHPQTQRVHTTYHQAVTITGRLSSSDPNLQNIPVRSHEGRRIRQAFIASTPTGKIIAADYSQIELRIMAHLSHDEGLLQAFSQGLDIHKATASEIFSTELTNVTQDQRRAAKAVNFGLIYGMSAFGLAKQLNVERRVAQDYINRYFARYPKVLDYMERSRATAHEQGYVETLFGRRLYLPDIKHRNASRRQYAERTAINAPMQGTAADIIKRAMLAVHDWMQTEQLKSRLIMQVHDELVFDGVAEELDQLESNIRTLMSQAANLAVPLVVDIGIGNNWDEAH